MIDYEEYAKMFKALSDPKRLKIVDMLSNGELCACKILEEFHITQPTLSHDMKLLCSAGLVIPRKRGKMDALFPERGQDEPGVPGSGEADASG